MTRDQTHFYDDVVFRLLLLSICVLSFVTVVLDCGRYSDALVVCIVGVTVERNTRRFAAVASVLLFALSHTSYSLPTSILSLSPLVWIWRMETMGSSLQCMIESIVVDFAMCWLITDFVQPAIPPWGVVLRGAGCMVYSLQIVGIASAIRCMHSIPIVWVAPPLAFIALALEIVQAWLGLTWATTNPSLAIAATQIAQWSGLLTPFGLSSLIYLANFLIVPGSVGNWWFRWLGPLLGSFLTVFLWVGGMVIESRIAVEPLPFTVLLAQPHVHFTAGGEWRPWNPLHRETLESLQNCGTVDLIVWPETCLSDSPYTADPIPASGSMAGDFEYQLTLQRFQQLLLPQYKTNCLLGVAMIAQGTTEKYGLTVPETHRFNCGCIVSPSASTYCHEKMILVPLKEGLPIWMQNEFVRQFILPFFQLQAPFMVGREFRPLKFDDRTGVTRTIVAAVCYESWHPWLPQYNQTQPIDAIVYMMYDRDFIDHPELMERQLLSVRMRAIETRTWNLVCSCWRGTAIIDPRGRIVKQLPAIVGVLRSDQLESK